MQLSENIICPINFIHDWKDCYICPIEFNRRKNVEFSVPGEPRGKERPRMVRMGNRITTYTPKNTVNYENLVRTQYRKQTGGIYLENAIEADITAIFSVPKSLSKKKRKELLENESFCLKKPDCDNIEKIIFDSLNEVAYHDDSQICKTNTTKKYGENPQVIVNLSEIY